MPRPHGRPVTGRGRTQLYPGMSHTAMPGEPARVRRYLPAYCTPILEATARMSPAPDEDDTFQIEECMRSQYSTLDNIDRRRFTALAKIAWLAVQELRADGTYKDPHKGTA